MREGSNQRVVLLFPGALGDLLLAVPALRALRRRHPASHLTLAVAGWLGPLAACTGIGDAVASLDDADTVGLFGGNALPRWFGDRPVLYSWVGSRDAAVRERLTGLASAATFLTVERGPGDVHAAVAYARALGVAASTDGLVSATRLVPPPSPAADAVIHAARRPLLLVHVGAGSTRKRWAHGGFREVARRWLAQAGDVLELVGPAEIGGPPLPGARRITGWTLPDVATLLAGVDVYVGNDSGVSHLASAVGISGVVIFGPTCARRWAPLGGRLRALEAALCPSEGISLEAVAPARVLQHLHECAHDSLAPTRP